MLLNVKVEGLSASMLAIFVYLNLLIIGHERAEKL